MCTKKQQLCVPGLVAAQFGIEANNAHCIGDLNNPWTVYHTCGNLYAFEANCTLAWSQPPKFKTGRKDCTPNPALERPFFTNREEIHANPQGNGVMTANFYRNHFNMTAREGIALQIGAHSMGKFHPEIALMKYSWTRHQEMLLNNQLFRQLAEKPQYFLDCKWWKKPHWYALVGDAWGQKANVTWSISALSYSKDGGPFHWFHKYAIFMGLFLVDTFTLFFIGITDVLLVTNVHQCPE